MPRAGGPHRSGRPPDRDVLARHGPAARARLGADGRPGRARPRRADQRARPGRHSLATPPAARARRRRADRDALQPRPCGDRAERRRGADPRPRPPARALGDVAHRVTRGRVPRSDRLERGVRLSALIAAEMLRLRTVRSPRWVALGGLVVVALTTATNVRSDATWTAGELSGSLRALALTGVLLAGVFAASTVASAFQRGEVPMTYLVHPRRTQCTAAQSLLHAAIGFVFAGLAAGVVAIVGLSIARGGGVTTTNVLRLAGGAAVGGAMLSAAGVLLGTATRHPMIASGSIVGLNLAEALASAHGRATY